MIQKNSPARAVGERGIPKNKPSHDVQEPDASRLERVKPLIIPNEKQNPHDREREGPSCPQKTTSYKNNDHEKDLQYDAGESLFLGGFLGYTGGTG